VDDDVLYGIAGNEALPPGLVDRLIEVADSETASVLAGRANLSRAQALALAARFEETAVRLAHEGRLTAADVDPVTQPSVALALLDERAGRPEWARRFAVDPDPERREKLASCPDLPPDVVETLAADPETGVVAELALWTTSDVAARLAAHPHAGVRRAVAYNRATPPAVLAALLTGEGLPPARSCPVCDREPTPFRHDPYRPRPDCDLPPDAECSGAHESTARATELTALENPATPAEAAVRFADHPSVFARQAVAARPGLPAEVYRRLAADPIPMVREALAENPAIDAHAIGILAADPYHDVRRALLHNPRLPLDVVTRLAAGTRTGPGPLPRIATATPDETAVLAASSDPAVRALVARRRDLPDVIRDALAADPDAKVAAAAAPHPGLSEARLRAVLARHGTMAAAAVAANPDTPPALLEELTRQQPPARKALRAIARHPAATAPALLTCLADHRARRAAAAHPTLPPATVAALLTDDDWQTARAAATNPALPPAVMAALISRISRIS